MPPLILPLCSKNFLQDPDHTNEATLTLVFLCSQLMCSPHQIGFKRFRLDQRSSEVTSPDHRVELHGHVIGIALDHSGRFLFANLRRWDQSGTSNIVLLPRWPLGVQPNNGEPPPIAQEIEMVVIDLNTLQILPKTYTGHKGFTPNSVKTLL